MQPAITAKSSSSAALARHAERRVSRCSSSAGSAPRKSSLNSSPRTGAFIGRSFVDPAQENVLHLEVFLEAVLRSLAPQARLLDAAERRDLGGDDADVGADDAGLHRLGHAENAADAAAGEGAGE